MKPRVCLFALAVVVMTSAVQAQSSRIAFSSSRSDCPGQSCTNMDIWKMKEDGSLPAQVTSVSTEEQRPSISFDGKKILFDDHDHIYMINPDGTGLQTLTSGNHPNLACGDNNGGFGCEDADASPAILGSQPPPDFRIVFTNEFHNSSWNPGDPLLQRRGANLYMATVDVSEGLLIDVIPLTDSSTCGDPIHYQVAWCGQDHIVWSREIGSACAANLYFWEICTIEVDNNGPMGQPSCYFNGDFTANQYPSCNSAGTMIAFARSDGQAPERNHKICTMNFNGTDMDCEILENPGNVYDDTRPVWSLGGNVIAFASNRPEDGSSGDPKTWRSG